MGTEINPFLAFVANAKLQQCEVKELQEHADIVTKAARKGRNSPLIGFSTFSERKGLEKWLFNHDVLRAFEGGTYANDQSSRSVACRILTKLCLIGAAMDACNATKDGKCLRYRSDWTDLSFGISDFVEGFERRISIVSEDLQAAPLSNSQAIVVDQDARKLTSGDRFRLFITSPPYLNSFDYTDIYRPELFLGKWVTDAVGLRNLRQKTLRSHIQAKWEDPVRSDFGDSYHEAMAAINDERHRLWNPRIPVMIQAYFEDIGRVLKRLSLIATDNATIWMVVSTSAYVGIQIPVDNIISDIAGSTGWSTRRIQVLRKLSRVPVQQWTELSDAGNGSPHLRESLLVLDAIHNHVSNNDEG